jgi:hypothetical protein
MSRAACTALVALMLCSCDDDSRLARSGLDLELPTRLELHLGVLGARKTLDDVITRLREPPDGTGWTFTNSFSGGVSAVLADVEPHPDDFHFWDVRLASPEEVRRGFVLEPRREWLLGEPIVVEFRVEVTGDGVWLEYAGGNYRGLGRDDNFFFVLEPAEGERPPDPYDIDYFHGKARMAGGISSNHRLSADEPLSMWLGVQQYSAITKPGHYDLYCLRSAGFQAFQAPAPLGRSPVAAHLPEALADIHGDRLTDFAHFRIEIRAGTPDEREAMIASSTELAADPSFDLSPSQAEAVRTAMWFARQDDFLPLIEEWMRAGKVYGPHQDGLALRGSKAARDLLLIFGDGAGIEALLLLPDAPDLEIIPPLLELLNHSDQAIRSASFRVLNEWTDERFGASWTGWSSLAPGLAEGSHIRVRAQRWWAEERVWYVLKLARRLLLPSDLVIRTMIPSRLVSWIGSS